MEVLGSPGASKTSKTRCRKVNIVQDGSRRRFGALFWCPRASQEAPKRLARGSQEAPETGQEAPKSYPRWGNSSRKSQEGLKRLPRRPKSSQEGPKRAQEGPQRVPRGSQEAPKRLPRGPQEAQNLVSGSCRRIGLVCGMKRSKVSPSKEIPATVFQPPYKGSQNVASLSVARQSGLMATPSFHRPF